MMVQVMGGGSTSALLGKWTSDGGTIEFTQDTPPASNRVAITAPGTYYYSLVISGNTATSLSGNSSFNFVLSNNNNTLTITNDTVGFDTLDGVYTRIP